MSDAWKERFRPGDRVRIIRDVSGWKGCFATIVHAKQCEFAAGHEHIPEGSGREEHAWAIHLDEYDYHLERSPGNHHTAWDGILEHDAPDDDELAAAMASIADAASRRVTQKEKT